MITIGNPARHKAFKRLFVIDPGESIARPDARDHAAEERPGRRRQRLVVTGPHIELAPQVQKGRSFGEGGNLPAKGRQQGFQN